MKKFILNYKCIDKSRFFSKNMFFTFSDTGKPKIKKNPR